MYVEMIYVKFFVILQQMQTANVLTLAVLRGMSLVTVRRHFTVRFVKYLPQREIIYISRS
jgi:hypothetical protein